MLLHSDKILPISPSQTHLNIPVPS